jgi:hypothetical protein
LTEFTHSDYPLEDPADDLLGMAPQAWVLARVLNEIKPPYTVGIYGKWGEGKTTYANLLIRYLAKQQNWAGMRIVRFSAWPYVTADAMWRALLDSIARKILVEGQEADGPPVAEDDAALPGEEATSTTWTFLRRVLMKEVLTIRGGEPVKPKRQQYERLRKRFDRSAALANRTPDRGGGVNMAALAGLVLDAASTLAPGISPLRKVLGIGEGSIREVFSGDEASRPASVVASVEDLRADLRELFLTSGQDGLKLVILLDDLDRCLPNVALDFLETVKLFFFESIGVDAPCLFIVAVDEGLLGRGLRLRIGEGQDVSPADEARIYLEKIVQLRVPVPGPDDDRVHQLVSACSPEWAWTTDLIALGIGRNPRRIKQQCSLMTYRFMAREAEDGAA